MKRISTFDLLRGIAILAVVIIHRIQWDYYSQHSAVQSLDAVFFVFSLISSMAGMFFCISGAVNTYINFNRLKEGKLSSRQVLIKSSISGLVLIIIGLVFRYFLFRSTDNVVSVNMAGEVLSYNETGVLPYMILYGVYPLKYNIRIFFQVGPLQMIGYSIIAVSITLVLYHKIKGLDNIRGFRRLLLSLGIVIFVISGFTYQFLWGPASRATPNDDLVTMLFLRPLVFGQFSIFPHLAFGFFGAYFGAAFANKKVEPDKVLRSMVRFWAILLCIGAVIFTICISLELFDTWYVAWGRKLLQLGIYFFLFWLGMKFIDYQPEKVRVRRLKWLSPLILIGRVTLTVFIFEGIVAASLQRLIAPIWAGWNASVGNTALFGLINLAVWIVIIIIWKQLKFIGSFEWTSALLVRALSGQKSSKMDKV